MEHNKRLKNVRNGFLGDGKIPIAIDTGFVTAGHSLAKWMAQQFNYNFDEYDQAIDSVYNQTHVGGSAFHHLLDGQHTVWGAFRAVQNVKADDSFVTEFLQAGEHLLRDVASVSGINPFFSLTSHQLDALSQLVMPFGISKPFLVDALTVNGPELLGGTIAMLSTLMVGKKKDPACLSRLSGAYLLSSVASGNPVLFPVAASSLVYSIVKSDSKKEVIFQGGKGAIVSGGALLTGSLVGGPVWIGCLASVAAAISLNYAIDQPEKTFLRVKELVKPTSSILRKVSLSIRR
ncbi:hypothetical protein [Neobacillus sp. Marseille-QA0830]